VRILQAVDRKSVALFALILAVCALFVANASGAAVRVRRSEYSVLAAVGWPRRLLFGFALVEIGGIGLSAGIVGSLLAAGLGWLFGTPVSPVQTAHAIPAALLLSLIAGAVPAARAARTQPAAALAAGTAAVRARPTPARRRPPTVIGLGLGGLTRAPTRTLLGTLAVAIGTAALTPLVAIIALFHGAVVGSVLGDAVSVRVRPVDLAGVAAIVALGAFAVADVLYLSMRERAQEYTLLRVIGWPDAAVRRLVLCEGIGLGVLGAVAGSALGLGIT
jgi:ABC-type antimicrobial peptide transport system permease subunit